MSCHRIICGYLEYQNINKYLPSIHPSIFFRLSRIRSVSLVFQSSISPATFPSSSWGTLRRSPGQMRYVIAPVSSWATQGSVPSWTCPENLQREALRAHPDQMPEPSQPPHSQSFGHYPELITIGEGWNVDRLVNRELNSTRSWPVQCVTAPTRMLIMQQTYPYILCIISAVSKTCMMKPEHVP